MRRGTPAAEAFGELLMNRRVGHGLTMREVGRRLGVPAATVSQSEKGQRAVKEHNLHRWAAALEIEEAFLRKMWVRTQELHEPAIVRTRGKSTKQDELKALLAKLTGPERDRVFGYAEALIAVRQGS